VGGHDVFYKGFREGKGIWGSWEVDEATGGFRIWPLASGENGDGANSEEKEHPVDAIAELTGAAERRAR
jgi:hypothetical protein